MSYNNYNRFGGNSARDFSFSKAGNQNRYQGGFSRAPYAQPKKHSGAKAKSDKNGNPCIVAWNYSRSRGMLSIFIAPYKNTAKHTSKAGKVYYNWIAKIFNKKTMQTSIIPCLVNEQCDKAVIQEIGFVVNCRASNGGYAGKFTKS